MVQLWPSAHFSLKWMFPGLITFIWKVPWCISTVRLTDSWILKQLAHSFPERCILPTLNLPLQWAQWPIPSLGYVALFAGFLSMHRPNLDWFVGTMTLIRSATLCPSSRSRSSGPVLFLSISSISVSKSRIWYLIISPLAAPSSSSAASSSVPAPSSATISRMTEQVVSLCVVKSFSCAFVLNSCFFCWLSSWLLGYYFIPASRALRVLAWSILMLPLVYLNLISIGSSV